MDGDSLKAHIENVASLEDLLKSISEERLIREQVAKCKEQITDNEAQLQRLARFKATLYENFVGGVIRQDEYKAYRDTYTEDGKRLQQAIDALRQGMEDAKNNTGERLKWTLHFKRFATMTALDRRAVIGLLQSIRVLGKRDLQITFRYQMEYEAALARLEQYKEVV